MNILEFKNISKSYFTQNLYKDVNLEINTGDKIALIGHNGTGKSTLINMIKREERPSSGKIKREENITIACFEQFGRIDLDKTVEELLNLPFSKVISVQKELEKTSEEFSDDSDANVIIMEKYTKLSDEFESLGGYDYLQTQASFIETFELGDKLSKKFKELSGGERQYIRLAITLFEPANLIILDEPLSFFDKRKTQWLSNYIKDSIKAFLVISHNVDFIRTFANKIFDIDNKRIESYECNYNDYPKEKKKRLAEDKKQNAELEEQINEMEEAIQKKLILLERCNNKHAHAVILRRLRKELEKLAKKRIHISKDYKYEYLPIPDEVFLREREIEPELVILENISKEFPEKVLYKNANLEIASNSKICLVGENGAGKTTLLKIITGEMEPTSGKVYINPKAKMVHIIQETVFEDENMSIKDYLQLKTGLSPDFVESAIDSLYAHEPEFRDKRIFMLSGGERKRLEIFAHTISDIDLLIIDEPTTYMDDFSRKAIAEMLLDYDGAVILVSHDKALLRLLKNFETYDIRDRLLRIKETGNK